MRTGTIFVAGTIAIFYVELANRARYRRQERCAMPGKLLTRRHFLQGSLAYGGLVGVPLLFGCSRSPRDSVEATSAALTSPIFGRPADGALSPEMWFGGAMGDRILANHQHWLLLAPAQNPDMIALLAPNSGIPLLDWSGEFVGKYLIAAAQGYLLNRDDALLQCGNAVVAQMVSRQESDGYIGAFYGNARMNGNWDAWNQYHCILGLYQWHRATRDAAGAIDALAPCLRAADYLAAWNQKIPAVKPGDEVKNLACAHVFTLLYRETGIARYLDVASTLYGYWMSDCGYPGGDPGNAPPYFQFSQPRWEGLHDVQTLAELYLLGSAPQNASFRTLFTSIWESILHSDIHNTGGFSSGEGATGNPYDPDAVETCATVAWMALCIDMLRLTGDARAADALEIATWNAVLGAQSVDGHLYTYDTPMGGAFTAHGNLARGTRTPANEELWWQTTPNGKALSCCAMNGPRGIGCLSEWAVMLSDDGIVVNYYGESRWTVSSPSGRRVALSQVTQYPHAGLIRITVAPAAAERFVLRLRIPAWSLRTRVTVNGSEQSGIVAGDYFAIDRQWSAGDTVELDLDLTPRAVDGGSQPIGSRGAGSTAGRIAIYVGPILMACDWRYAGIESENALTIDRSRVAQAQPLVLTLPPAVAPPLHAMAFPTTAGGNVILCDFASAGQPTRVLLSPALVAGATWQFSRVDGTVLAERMQLLPSGSISGYSHPNEASWAIEGGDLVFRSQSGDVSSRLFVTSLQNGKKVLQGPSLFTPTITHLLSEQDATFTGKSWQFRRADGSLIATRLQLLGDGTISGYFFPNEARWGVENGVLVFYDTNGNATTRFTSQQTRRGCTVLRGPFLGDSTIVHVLVEIDDDVTRRVWNFERGDGAFITRLRLLADGTLFRFNRQWFDHEASWGYDNGVLVFKDTQGVPSTRFSDRIDAAPTGMTLSGPFLRAAGITHVLREVSEVPPVAQTDWEPGPLYSSWLASR
jgi:DUF1680 family protein